MAQTIMRYGVFFLLLGFFLTGCSYKEPRVSIPSSYNDQNPQKRAEVVNTAQKYLHKKDGGDCSGFVMLVNQESHEPFVETKKLPKFYEDSRRSLAIYNLLDAEKRLYTDNPKVGDLVFFANTIKKYSTIRHADNITHIGIIVKIEADGTVQFIHHTRGQNILGYLNMRYPDLAINNGKMLNSYMEKCPPKQSVQCLAPAYFSAYGAIK